MASDPADPAQSAPQTAPNRPAPQGEAVFSAPPPRPADAAAAPPRPATPPQGKLTPADATTAAAVARAAAGAAAAAAAGGAPAARPAAQAAVAAQPAARPAAAPGAQAPAQQAPAQPPAVARQAPAPATRPAGGPPALPPNAAALAPPRPPAPAATPRRRHWMLVLSFLLLVLLPSAVWGWYLWNRAADQYTSTVGFSVRREEGAAPIDMFGGIFGGTASSTASDTDILYEFIRSPDLVARTDKALDLRGKFSAGWPRDFVFAFDPSGTIEDLTDYWHRQVKIYYDDSSGIITVRVSAFSPADAKAIADTIFAESEKVVNGLSEQARVDATKQAAAELEKARGVLTEARQAMTAFRVRTRIVDPTVDLGAQMTVMTALQGQLAEAQVALDTLRQNARAKDQRVIQAEKRVAALQGQIEAERDKFGGEDSPEGENYAQLMADYERLKVDLEFAEGAHQTARVGYESALATAQRQTRYLAAHIAPTEAQRSLEPDRPWLLAMGAGLAFVLWSIMILVYYSVRDRR